MSEKKMNVLFISNSIFGYEKKIKKAIEEKYNANVDYFNDRVDDDFFTKVVTRLGSNANRKKINEYYHKIVDDNIEKNYDYVFFMRAESPYPEDLEYMHEKFSNAKFILYLSDAVDNLPKYDLTKKYFDRIFSFDTRDCASHPEMKFRPLFYTSPKSNEDHFEYDITFIGTLHSDRGDIVKSIIDQAKEKGFTYYFRLYVQSKVILLARLLTNSNVRKLYKDGYVTLEKMKSEDVHAIETVSKTVLDIEHVKQSGLTLRNCEVVGMGKKMITTNFNIKQYDFYNPNNIIVFDRTNPVVDVSFFDKKYVDIDEEIYKKYSLDYWLEELFGE